MSRLRTALVVVILSACGRSAAHEAADAKQELSSWQSTARLAESERARGAIPAEFAEQVRRADSGARAAAEAKLAEAKLRKATGP